MSKTLYDYCKEHRRNDLLSQWCSEKNDLLTPDTISYGSKKKVWWRCEKGHEWQAPVYSRTGAKTQCPYCKNLKLMPGKNDLASQNPDLAAQWHPTKNGILTPKDVMIHSWKKVWWLCENGHEWQAQINPRSTGIWFDICVLI